MRRSTAAAAASMVAACLLGGCGGGGGGSAPVASAGAPPDTAAAPAPAPATAPPPLAVTPPATVTQALAQAEANGSLPTLNRDDSVGGPDANRNGVRDDIDTFIASLPDTVPQKAALVQKAASLQRTLVADPRDEGELARVAAELAAASSCAFTRYTAEIANNRSLALEKMTVNTKTRFVAYDRYNHARNGRTVRLPKGDGCVR